MANTSAVTCFMFVLPIPPSIPPVAVRCGRRPVMNMTDFRLSEGGGAGSASLTEKIKPAKVEHIGHCASESIHGQQGLVAKIVGELSEVPSEHSVPLVPGIGSPTVELI